MRWNYFRFCEQPVICWFSQLFQLLRNAAKILRFKKRNYVFSHFYPFLFKFDSLLQNFSRFNIACTVYARGLPATCLQQVNNMKLLV